MGGRGGTGRPYGFDTQARFERDGRIPLFRGRLEPGDDLAGASRVLNSQRRPLKSPLQAFGRVQPRAIHRSECVISQSGAFLRRDMAASLE